MRANSDNTGIGQPVRRREDFRLLTGKGCYSDDFNFPGQAYAVMVRSPHSHAKIRSIDGAAALAILEELRAKSGGVLQRAGHTEAAVDLVVLAGARPIGVICEIMNADGTMARMPDLRAFATACHLLRESISTRCPSTTWERSRQLRWRDSKIEKSRPLPIWRRRRGR